MRHYETRSHERDLARAFDDQAGRFERAPVQSDPEALRRLVEWADLPRGCRVLDAGCGPGLVAEALLEAGAEVFGVDLSREMIEHAERRCERFGGRARFYCGSLYDDEVERAGCFGAAISRSVLHHVEDPSAFVARQTSLLGPRGALVISDHTTDTDPETREVHRRIERARDRTHVANATPGELVDLMGGMGLASIRLVEEPFTLDFDEWFDRGSPSAAKAEVRKQVQACGHARGFRSVTLPDRRLQIECWRALVRGVKPDH